MSYLKQSTTDDNRMQLSCLEAVEYADCIFAEGYSFPPTSFLDMTLNRLMAKFQFWTLENVEYPFIAITPRSTQTRSDSTIYG